MMDLITHTNKCLQKIEEQNDELNIVLSVNPDVMDEAKAIQKKIDAGKAGKLAGKIIGVKSNICVEGLEVNCGSKTLEGWHAPYDADAIKRIKEEDGLIIGMLNMDEFACGSAGEHSAFGPTRNPRAKAYVTGGTSSGSAAAIAAEFCDIALGTDTGGSIRTPASHCGVVGIKPSYGTVSRFGLIDSSMSQDQIAPIGKTVADTTLLLDIISKKSNNDPTMNNHAEPHTHGKHKDLPKNLKVGYSPVFDGLCTDKRILQLIKHVAEKFTKQYNTTEVKVDLKHVDLAIQAYYPLQYVEFYSGTRKFDGRKFGKPIEETCRVEVLRRILGGKLISQAEHEGKYYKKALAAKKIITDELNEALQKCDVMFLPTTPVLPHKIGEKISVEAEYAYDAFTIPASLAGICAGVVPAGTIDGIPVGIQIYAGAGKEELLTQVMYAIEQLQK